MRTFSTLVAMVALGVALAACDGLKPCSGASCPKMEGTWNFLYTPGTPSGNCDGVTFPAPPPTLVITRAGARIYSTVSGMDLEGTIFEDNSFSMRADTLATDGGTGQRIELRGDYRGPLDGDAGSGADGGTASADGNPRLTGTYTQVNGQTGDSCRSPSTFSAFK